MTADSTERFRGRMTMDMQSIRVDSLPVRPTDHKRGAASAAAPIDQLDIEAHHLAGIVDLA